MEAIGKSLYQITIKTLLHIPLIKVDYTIMEDTLNHLQFHEVKLRFFREDMLILKSLPLDIRVEFKSYLHQNGRYTHVHGEDAPIEPIPETRLFDVDLERLSQLRGEELISYIKRMVEEKRYIIVTQLDEYKVPKFPKAEHQPSFFFHMNPEKKVEYNLWNEDFGSICITLLLDNFIKMFLPEGGWLYLLPEETRNIGLRTLEDMSSGFEIINSGPSENGEFLRIAVSTDKVKDELIVSDNPYRCFTWCDCDLFFSNKYGSGEHKVLTSKYGHKYILNIPVSGEFNLSIYYQPKGKDVKFLMNKQFCCK